MADKATIKAQTKTALNRLVEVKERELDELKTLLKTLDTGVGDALIDALHKSFVSKNGDDEEDGSTNFEQVASYLRKHNNAWKSSPEIMAGAAMSRSAVNGVLYGVTTKWNFEQKESDTRKGGVLWRLKE